ncbi:MAG TPA: ATP-binding cassette domain-containing protein [Burkholderiaceae bacterium]|nr:ATP-binding cassette domain-containing protein [Burkholderiaceae bacterium]
MLAIKNINVDLAGNRILRDVNVTLEQSTTVGIVGHNGAGKTTLLRTIMGLVTPVSGQIFLGDVDLTSTPAHLRTSHGIGYSPEDRVIFPTMSVRENLMMPCEVLGQSDTQIQQRLESVLETVPELKEMLNRSGAALSGGQGKMVALGRALMVGTTLLLLDEPFQGLAPRLAQVYTEALSRLKLVQPELCVVITESNVKLLSDIPDKILEIERGSIRSNTTTEV